VVRSADRWVRNLDDHAVLEDVLEQLRTESPSISQVLDTQSADISNYSPAYSTDSRSLDEIVHEIHNRERVRELFSGVLDGRLPIEQIKPDDVFYASTSHKGSLMEFLLREGLTAHEKILGITILESIAFGADLDRRSLSHFIFPIEASEEVSEVDMLELELKQDERAALIRFILENKTYDLARCLELSTTAWGIDNRSGSISTGDEDIAWVVSEIEVEPGEEESAPRSNVDIAKGHYSFGLAYDISSGRVLDRDLISAVGEASTVPVHLLADKLIIGHGENQSKVERGLRLGTALIAASIHDAIVAGATHEFGHFRAFEQAGFELSDFRFVNNDDPTDNFSGSALGAFRVSYLHGLDLLSGAADGKYSAFVSDEAWEEFINDPERFRQWKTLEVMMEAGGFNQSQHNLDRVADRILSGDGQLTDLAWYYSNFLVQALYPNTAFNGDKGDYVSALERLGVDSSTEDLNYAHAARLLSNSHISLVRGAAQYVRTGQRSITPISFDVGKFEVYLPEFNSHLTLHGPTVGSSVRVDRGLHSVELGFEYALGDSMREMSVGWKGPLKGRLSGEAKLFRNLDRGGVAVEVGPVVEFNLGKNRRFMLAPSYYSYNGYTFRRELVGSVVDVDEKNSRGWKVATGFKFRF